MGNKSAFIVCGLLAVLSLVTGVRAQTDSTSSVADARSAIAKSALKVHHTFETEADLLVDSQALSSTDCNNNGNLDGNDIATGVSMDCNGTGIPDECEVGSRATIVFTTLPPVPIVDGFTVSRTFNVPAGGDVLDVDVSVTLAHEYPGDLAITLSHGGVSVDVFLYGPCAACATQCGFGGTVFDDEADGPVPCTHLNEGSYLPFNALSAFDGMDPEGAWTLEIFDGFIGFEGSFSGWSLVLETSTPLDCDVNGIPDECDIAAGTSGDCNANGTPDECELDLDDCNGNGIPDECDTAIPDSIDQWASRVLGFSSQYTASDYSAEQVLGIPNTANYADVRSAWASANYNGTIEFVSVGYDQPVFADGVTVRETYGNGFVIRVDAIDTFGGIHTLWEDVDPSLPGMPVDFRIDWTRTEFLVAGITIVIDTDANLKAWEEIDAIQLHGAPPASNDCNTNGTPDACDLANGSADCNQNGIPDDCDIAPRGELINQWASEVIGFSSETEGPGVAVSALGEPDSGVSWGPFSIDGSLEFLTVGYATPVYATGVTIREYLSPGFVYRVDVVDMKDVLHTVWQGTDPGGICCGVDVELTWAITSYPVKGVKVYVDTDTRLESRETIDAILLHGKVNSDCNGNGMDDWCEFGTDDCNDNGIPDGCDVMPLPHNCCDLSDGTGCSDSFIQDCVCKMIPDCCSVSWNAACVQAVEMYGCSSCEGGMDDCNANDVPDGCDVAPLGNMTDQWASDVIDFSSEVNGALAVEALGPPDAAVYDAGGSAWNTLTTDGTLEYLTVGCASPVYATGVTIRESGGNGMVFQVDVLDTNDVLHIVWQGVDPTPPVAILDFVLNWPITSYPVKGVRVHTDTDSFLGEREYIDAIALHGRDISDCDENGTNDWCEYGIDDCNGNGSPDVCDLMLPSHGCCDVGEGAACTDPDILGCVCKFEPDCCSVAWTETCVEALGMYGCGSCESSSIDCNENDFPDECELGDFDKDGTLTLIDYLTFYKCYTAPEVFIGLGCDAGDFDCDGDIDLRDFAEFQLMLPKR